MLAAARLLVRPSMSGLAVAPRATTSLFFSSAGPAPYSEPEALADRVATNAPAKGQPQTAGQGETPEELINSIPPIVVKGRVAACDGGKGALGHPRVYLKLDAPGVPCTCGYCGLRYVQEHH